MWISYCLSVSSTCPPLLDSRWPALFLLASGMNRLPRFTLSQLSTLVVTALSYRLRQPDSSIQSCQKAVVWRVMQRSLGNVDKAEEEGRQLIQRRLKQGHSGRTCPGKGSSHLLRVQKLAGRAYHILVPCLYFITAAEYQVTPGERKRARGMS